MTAAAIRVPFNVLRPGDDRAAIDAAVARVFDSGWFVLGPEVAAFETEFAAAAGAAHAVGVNTGTDAIALALRALGIGPGDEVITSPLSAAYSALAIDMTGARPVFADVDPVRLTLDPGAVAAAVTARTRAVLPVHLYGQPADMDGIARVAARHGLVVVEDACQAHLATAGGRPVGRGSAAAAYSFYPTKNLGALGDGGAVVTDDAALAERLRRLRNYGSSRKYVHEEPGVNSRLDELQAAFLRARLTRLDMGNAARRAIAARYGARLAGKTGLVLPAEASWAEAVYHLYVVRSARRDALRADLAAAGVETLIHYPVACHLQPAFASLGFGRGAFPLAEQLAAELLSLPLWPGMGDAGVDEVARAVLASD